MSNMKQKKKPFFNIIDVLVVLILIVAIAASFWLLRNKNASIGSSFSSSAATPVEFTLLVLKSDAVTIPDIERQIGADVYCSTDNSYLGTLTAVEPEVYSNIEYSTVAGSYVIYEDEAYRTVYLTIRGDASITDKDITVGSSSIKVGATLAVKGKGFAVNSYIVDINDNLEL